MWYLREKLRSADQALYGFLERNWEIAYNEWLPGINSQEDSYNAYPHLRNLELYLDSIVREYDEMASATRPFFISAIELYVMLASILFHDIGRTIAGQGHGEESSRLILRDRAELGIPSDEIAEMIAKVCRFHDLDREEATIELPNLATVMVGSYGEIRERCLAAVLTLVDHLDGSVSRVIPNYIKSIDQKSTVGAFRSIVRGVGVDLLGQFVKIELGEWPEKDPRNVWKKPGTTERIGIKINQKFVDRFSDRAESEKNLLKSELGYKEIEGMVDGTPEFSEAADPSKLSLALGIETGGGLGPWFLTLVENQSLFVKVANKKLELSSARGIDEALSKFDSDEYDEAKARFAKQHPKIDEAPSDVASARILRLFLRRQLAETLMKLPVRDFSWPGALILSIILGNLYENNEAMDPIRPVLLAMGIPIRKWLIEYKEHLYTEEGQETYEPVFYRQYLIRVAEAMWELSLGLFGIEFFTYKSLAAHLRENNEAKVRLAVKRIGIITEDYRPSTDEDKSGSRGAFWIGDSGWRWKVRGGPVNQGNASCAPKCAFMHFKDVRERIEGLIDPNGEPND